MLERIATVIIGGQNLYREHIRVRMTGDDLSDERLTRAKDEATAATGINVEHLFGDSDDTYMSDETVAKLSKGGIYLTTESEARSDGPTFYTEDEEGRTTDYDATALVMAYLGYHIKGFDYIVIPDDIIVGGVSTSVIKDFGYGLV